MSILWIMAALVVVGAGALARQRIRGARHSPIDDDAIRRIELGLPLEADEPIDLDEVRSAEDEFWADPEEPEEFGA
ncbi:MAG TPA: hypothetical protein VFU06_08060 [Longimicrobiales bacterium]|nr:hypothetical protein [Longimicrobiales bacterium]